MKTRSGFVSNSSSSSFVLSTNKTELSDIKLKVVSTLAELDDVRLLKDMNAVVQWMNDNYSYELNGTDIDDYIKNNNTDDYIVQMYAKCVEVLNTGRSIVIGSVSSDSDSTQDYYLLNNGFKGSKTEDFEIIEDTNF